MKFDPTTRKGFERIGGIVETIENCGSKKAGRLLSRFVSVEHSRSGDWKADAEWALENEKPIRARALVYAVGLVFLALLLWAAFAQLDEVVNGVGKAIPSGGTRVVQSVDGGVVEAILVEEGQEVSQGDVLVKVDLTRFSSMLGQHQAKVLSLMAKALRLEALSQGVPFEPTAELAREIPQIVELENQLYHTSLEERDSRIEVLKQQASQRRQELAELNARLSQVSRSHELAVEELNVTKPLLESGAVPKVEILRLEREVARAKGDLDQLRAQRTRARSAIEEAEGQIKEVELRYRNLWRNELSDTMGEIKSLTEGEKALSDRITHAEIRSPITGDVKRIFVNTPGAVIMPGGAVAEIVPEEGGLVVETRLSPRDRAFIKPGHDAVVKFTAFEYAIFGGLEGTVEHISPDTITDEKGNTFYLARIVTDKTNFGEDLPVLPGMVAQVDIKTGKKTVLAYLLKPILRARANALRER
jgi:adhesin transport system membrane fusion protein